ncbi:Bardet-Biedl syndrome 4 [Dermacentor variabilis]|uniref:Bardet-Biedl syndrome 4 n=1 Tax=Dermacentor variabilis TaxID=34621 RepID=UPI003F5AF4AB
MASSERQPLAGASGTASTKSDGARSTAGRDSEQEVNSVRSRVKKAPEHPSIDRKNWLIHMHFVRREFDICKALIKEMLAETKGYCEYALYIQALILRHEGNISESLEVFQSCALLNGDASILKQVARSLFLLGRHKAAADIYEECLKLKGKCWDILHYLGLCYAKLKDYEQARQRFAEAIQQSPRDETFIALGELHVANDDMKSAVNVFRKAVENNPESAELNTKLGLLYMQCNMYPKAFERLGAALASNPSYGPAVLAAGSIMQTYGDYDVALTKYRAIASAPDESPALWNNVGMCFFGKKKYVAAISCLKRANYLNPMDWQILHNLGLVHLTMEQYASAYHFFNAAVHFNPRNGQLFMLLAIALRNLQDPDNAKRAYERAMTLDEEPLVCLNYAVLMHDLGDHKAAARLLGQFEERCLKQQQTSGIEIDAAVTQMANNLSSSVQSTSADSKSYDEVPDSPDRNDESSQERSE